MLDFGDLLLPKISSNKSPPVLNEATDDSAAFSIDLLDFILLLPKSSSIMSSPDLSEERDDISAAFSIEDLLDFGDLLLPKISSTEIAPDNESTPEIAVIEFSM